MCSVLARLGWGAALTRDGLERTDILAVRAEHDRRMVEIQVKTATDNGPRTKWVISGNAQQCAHSDREWFAFVIMPQKIPAAPRTFLVPRDHVAAGTWIFHQHWATDPTVRAGQRNPRNVPRMEIEAWRRYEERWDLLERSTTNAPVLLPARARDLALDPRVGLPPDHPWRDQLPQWN